jgi:DnaJ homolog subfamily A member 5
VEIATQKFAEVQAAYDILSDPQERAWYDSHRDAILNGDDGYDDDAASTAFQNVRLTSTAEILNLMRKFNATVPFTDEPTGFFGILRETFEHLAMEEHAAADFDGISCPDYPTFGSSEDAYESTVKPFYSVWIGFASKKTFSWKDKYRLSDAPDRRVRRLMEKENKKLRDDALREFNDAVRFLVKFVRKRDPRYLPNTQTDAERQKSMREAAAAQAIRSRVANQEKASSFQLPDWAHSRDAEADAGAGEDHVSGSDEESEVEILECVVCNKTFKSDKQLEAHEKSKKHIKAVRQLRHEMRKEGAELDLEPDPVAKREPAAHESNENAVRAPATSTPAPDTDNVGIHDHKPQSGDKELDSSSRPGIEHEMISSSSHASEDEYAPRDIVLDRILGNHENEQHTRNLKAGDRRELSEALGQTSLDETLQERKVGKAKAKRAKKAAAASAADTNDMVRFGHRPVIHPFAASLKLTVW